MDILNFPLDHQSRSNILHSIRDLKNSIDQIKNYLYTNAHEILNHFLNSSQTRMVKINTHLNLNRLYWILNKFSNQNDINASSNVQIFSNCESERTKQS